MAFAGMRPHYYQTDLQYCPAWFPTTKEIAGSGTYVLTLAVGTDEYHQQKGPSVCYNKLEVPYGETGAKPKAGFPPPPATIRWDSFVAGFPKSPTAPVAKRQRISKWD